MELEIIQARALLAPVLGSRYEDCENGNHKSHSGEDAQASKNTGTNAQPQTDAQLTEEERQIVEELRIRDREVRAHEQAHKLHYSVFKWLPPLTKG